MRDNFLRSYAYWTLNHEHSAVKDLSNRKFSQKDVDVISEEFAQECLRCHNHCRVRHGCPTLHLSIELSQFSQQWAEHIAAEDHLHHSHHHQYGENLFVAYSSSASAIRGNEVVELWYSEHRLYPNDGHVTRETLSRTGHFTQVVWSSSRDLGIGKAISQSNRVYVVANYYPPGNVLKKIATNVPNKIHGMYDEHYHSRSHSRRFYLDSWIHS